MQMSLVSSFQVFVQLGAFSNAQPLSLHLHSSCPHSLLCSSPVFMLSLWLQGSKIWEHTGSLIQRQQKGPGDAAVLSLLTAFKASQVGTCSKMQFLSL